MYSDPDPFYYGNFVARTFDSCSADCREPCALPNKRGLAGL